MKTGLLISLILLTSVAIIKSKPYNAKAALKQLNTWCSYVPGGSAVVEGDTVSVQGFYMSSTEVTNFQYNEFLWHLKKNGAMEKYEKAQIDSTRWALSQKCCEPYQEYYHRHPAYKEYPVVNISKEGAELFCEWMTEMYDSISGGEMKLKFRIPTRAEYLRAARGDEHDRVYTWKGVSIHKRDGKSVFHGQVQANCIINGAECIRRNPETGKLEYVPADYPQLRNEPVKSANVIAPAKSYWANDFGFYNINGNVAEMISDGEFAVGGSWYSPGYDIRNESIESFTSPQPTVGFRVVASYLETVK